MFIPVDEVIPGVQADERTLVQLLGGLSRDDTLFHCARINTIITGPGDFDNKSRQEQALAFTCTHGQIDRINDFARRNKASGIPTIFFRGQLLELMRWTARHCKNLPNDGTTYEDPAYRERFATAALIASRLWSNRTYKDRLSAEGDVAELRIRALGAMRKGVEETSVAPHIGIAIGRGIKLFSEYLPAKLPEFSSMLEEDTGLTFHKYITAAACFVPYLLQRRVEGPLFMRPSKDATGQNIAAIEKFLLLESQSPDELANSFWHDFEALGYRALRERPIMLTADGRGMILDPTFFIEKISIGALFHVAKGKKRADTLKIFSAFGDAFEAYTADTFERMYPRRPGLVDRMSFNIKGVDGAGRKFEIDAALPDVPQAVVFEAKAAFLREDAVRNPLIDAVLKDIRAKYSGAASEGERDKGVAQLARSIGAIVRGEWNGPQREFEGITVVHPVLVVHDTRLDTPALGHFLAKEFVDLLGTVPPGKRVAPLTVMTIEDLENLERSVSNFSLVNLLDDYSRDCPDRMRSLHNYMAFSTYAEKILPSDFLRNASFEMIDAMRQEMFPKIQPETNT